MDTNNQINSIRDRVFQKPDLVINRVPKTTLKQFKDLGNTEDFADDWGFCLKFLMDFYIGLIPTGIEHIELELNSLREEISILKRDAMNKENEEKKKPVRKTLAPEQEE